MRQVWPEHSNTTTMDMNSFRMNSTPASAKQRAQRCYSRSPSTIQWETSRIGGGVNIVEISSRFRSGPGSAGA